MCAHRRSFKTWSLAATSDILWLRAKPNYMLIPSYLCVPTPSTRSLDQVEKAFNDAADVLLPSTVRIVRGVVLRYIFLSNFDTQLRNFNSIGDRTGYDGKW